MGLWVDICPSTACLHNLKAVGICFYIWNFSEVSNMRRIFSISYITCIWDYSIAPVYEREGGKQQYTPSTDKIEIVDDKLIID